MLPEWWDWQAFAVGVGVMMPVAMWLYSEWKNDRGS